MKNSRNRTVKRTYFTELKRVFDRLHGPRGCLWDKKQTHDSILSHFKEELGEFVSAVRKRDYENMKEELGDMLLHVMFHAQIASKAGRFTIEDIIAVLIAKLKRRHPHVFGSLKVTSQRQIIRNWEEIKRLEKKRPGVKRSGAKKSVV